MLRYHRRRISASLVRKVPRLVTTRRTMQRLHDRNNDACWISAGELTDYSFGARDPLANQPSVSAYFISTTLPPMHYLRDRLDRVILHFLTYVRRLGPVTIAVSMVAEDFFT